MAGIGGVLDIVKIRKTGSKTRQNRFRIFPSTFLDSLGPDGRAYFNQKSQIHVFGSTIGDPYGNNMETV